ncbi:TetR/AcrR family transcriptional regulator, partial [Streptomyces minutiscleroticus]|uniref:TetR/AcrR family transcriptional regulator n=1 Tax=Streptomyces minutiscleroticus TaxID=68238 RepID=UPI003322AD06
MTTGGTASLGLREIARRAGVSHGAPRRYFPTHHALLPAIAHRGFADLAARFEAAAGGARAGQVVPGGGTVLCTPQRAPGAVRTGGAIRTAAGVLAARRRLIRPVPHCRCTASARTGGTAAGRGPR